jgi:hypothetical protein
MQLAEKAKASRKKTEWLNQARGKEGGLSDERGTPQEKPPGLSTSFGQGSRRDKGNGETGSTQPPSQEESQAPPSGPTHSNDDVHKGPCCDLREYRLPAPDADPPGASMEELLFLQNERYGPFLEQEGYYEVVRLKMNARYQKRLNSHQENVLRTKMAIRDRESHEAPSPTRGRNDTSTNHRNENGLHAEYQRRQRNGRAAEEPDQGCSAGDEDIEDRISLLDFGYRHRG